jgi:hypothetical protein
MRKHEKTQSQNELQETQSYGARGANGKIQTKNDSG